MNTIHSVTTVGSTAGAQTPLDHGDYFAPVDLHSQALLSTFVQSNAFREMTSRLPELLRMVFNSNLFANPTDTGTKNLLEHLIRHQVGLRDPATGAVTMAADAMLDRFTADLDKQVLSANAGATWSADNSQSAGCGGGNAASDGAWRRAA